MFLKYLVLNALLYEILKKRGLPQNPDSQIPTPIILITKIPTPITKLDKLCINPVNFYLYIYFYTQRSLKKNLLKKTVFL